MPTSPLGGPRGEWKCPMPFEMLDSTDTAIADFLARFRAAALDVFFSSPEKKDDAEYVLLEILNNTVEHGHHFNADKKIRVEWTVDTVELAVRVEDEGNGFSSRPPFSGPPAGNPRGRGLWSIQADVRHIGFNEKGNCVNVTFERS